MKRYLRLYLHFLRFSFSRAFEFRVDFWFRMTQRDKPDINKWTFKLYFAPNF